MAERHISNENDKNNQRGAANMVSICGELMRILLLLVAHRRRGMASAV